VFEQYGTISHVLVIPSRTHDTNTAYVDFETEAAAQKVRAFTSFGTEPVVLTRLVTAPTIKIRVLRMLL
jgi:hypothetical protein